MSHYNEQQWRDYITSEKANPTMEKHLLTCDTCLTTYLQVSSEQSDHAFSDDFTTTILSSVTKMDLYEKKEVKPKWYDSTIFHYTMAASLTLILVSSGFFSSMAQWSSKFEDRPSFTEQIMHDMYTKKQLIEEENN